LAEAAEVVGTDVFEFLDREPRPFDFVFIAPPQYQGLWARTLYELDARTGWLERDGWAIAQIDPSEYEDLLLENLVLFDQREYGGVTLCFYALRTVICEE
jgi:16S rRNA G966 N2-methylase RsmD